MTTIDLESSSLRNKLSPNSTIRKSIISIPVNGRPILHLCFDKRQRGGQGLGKCHQIKDIVIDNENRAFARIIVRTNNRTGRVCQLVPFGRLSEHEEEETI